MDGFNDKKRKRIISWLFSKRYREKRKKEEEEKKKQEVLINVHNKSSEETTDNKKDLPKSKEQNKSKNNENIIVQLDEKENSKIIPSSEKKELNTNNKHDEQSKPAEKEIEILVNEPTTSKPLKPPIVQETTQPLPEVPKPLAEQPEKETIELQPEKEVTEQQKSQPQSEPETKPIPTVLPPPEIIEEEKAVDNNTLLQIAVIEEIDKVIKNDISELRDIKYKVEVLNKKEQDQVLVSDIEHLQKELDDLLKKFYEIKKKYEKAYNNISLSNITDINNLDVGYLINDYISIKKGNKIEENILTQINEIKEFIEIIDNIIVIEKEKDTLDHKFNDKLDKFNIRDTEFIKLQDSYTDIEKINENITKYNYEIDSIIKDMNAKIANSTDVTKRMETITSIIPDSNRLMKATALMASREFIPPTPLGLLFKATLFISATNMLVNAFIPRTEEKEITKIAVKDYSKDIMVNQDMLNGVITDIDQALQQIDYMKKTFTTEFSQYQGQIPEYNTLIENIFTIEKNLKAQQSLAYSYDEKMANALSENNEKVKILENDNN